MSHNIRNSNCHCPLLRRHPFPSATSKKKVGVRLFSKCVSQCASAAPTEGTPLSSMLQLCATSTRSTLGKHGRVSCFCFWFHALPRENEKEQSNVSRWHEPFSTRCWMLCLLSLFLFHCLSFLFILNVVCVLCFVLVFLFSFVLCFCLVFFCCCCFSYDT